MAYLALVLAKIKWAIAFAAVVGLSMGVPRLFEPPATDYQLRVPMETAAGLYPGSDVEIAGARAGRVNAISLAGSGALVTISVDGQHAPVRSDAKIDLRPKSLLGEKYLALDPGRATSTLASGATLPSANVTRSVELEEVFNTLDQPTRDKLQVLVDELGAGFADQGPTQNRGIAAGAKDLDDLSNLADALAQRDQELKDVLRTLSVVTDELARSDRRTQLGDLIRNTEALMKTLADQDAQIQRALTQTNAALSRTDVALAGTGGNLNSINTSLGSTVDLANGLTGDLGMGLDSLLPHLDQFITGVQAGPRVFGGRDANGYATRISVVAGTGTLGVSDPLQQLPANVVPGGHSAPPANSSAITSANPGDLGAILGFVLQTPAGGGGQP